MQDTPEDVPGERSDFPRVLGLCKCILNGVNDLSFLLGAEEIIKASKKGDILESQGPSHFLNQRDIRLPLEERA